MVSVVLVDDQDFVRRGLRRILNQEKDINVIGECEDGDQVIDTITTLKPDLVLMDVRMKRMDGISTTQAIQKLANPPPISMLTTFGDEHILCNALAAGAAGFILKNSPPNDLIRATQVIAAGGAWLDPNVTDKVIEHYRAHNPPQKHEQNHVESLTAKEREVLVLIADGLLNREIADELSVSEATIKTHVSHIFAKLGARDRAAAIIHAFNHGIVVPRR